MGKDLFVCFSPEREDPGNERFPTHAIPKILGGITPACVEAGMALYGAAIDRVIPVSSTRTAEMVKLLENVHRAVNIGLANEMKIICDRMGIDVHEVIRAAATKPFGFGPLAGGGSAATASDRPFTSLEARAYGVHTASRARRRDQSRYAALGASRRSSVNDLRNDQRKQSLVLASRTEDVDDLRESPALELCDPRRQGRALLSSISLFRAALGVHETFRGRGNALVELSRGDGALATDHDAFDYTLY